MLINNAVQYVALFDFYFYNIIHLTELDQSQKEAQGRIKQKIMVIERNM